MKFKYIVAAAALATLPPSAWAECKVDGSGEVNVLSNFFETLELLANTMKECEREGLVVTDSAPVARLPELKFKSDDAAGLRCPADCRTSAAHMG